MTGDAKDEKPDASSPREGGARTTSAIRTTDSRRALDIIGYSRCDRGEAGLDRGSHFGRARWLAAAPDRHHTGRMKATQTVSPTACGRVRQAPLALEGPEPRLGACERIDSK